MMIQATGSSCTREQLVEGERRVIDALGWHLLVGTLADWVLFYLNRMESEGVAIPFDLYFRCMDLCDRLVLDYHVCVWLCCDVVRLVSAEGRGAVRRVVVLLREQCSA